MKWKKSGFSLNCYVVTMQHMNRTERRGSGIRTRDGELKKGSLKPEASHFLRGREFGEVSSTHHTKNDTGDFKLDRAKAASGKGAEVIHSLREKFCRKAFYEPTLPALVRLQTKVGPKGTKVSSTCKAQERHSLGTRRIWDRRCTCLRRILLLAGRIENHFAYNHDIP